MTKRSILGALTAAVFAAGCGGAPTQNSIGTDVRSTDGSTTSSNGGQASLQLSNCSNGACAYDTYPWTISKSLTDAPDSGGYSSSDGFGGFTVTVTKGDVQHMLKFAGTMTITNTATGTGATAYIGNFLVNLQTRQGNQWKTVSSVIADATHLGEPATTAAICAGASSENRNSFGTNTYSDGLNVTTSTGDSVFSIVNPFFSLPPTQSVVLNYVASFKNLGALVAAGQQVRIEAIVTFANAGARGGSGAVCMGTSLSSFVDANGNGTFEQGGTGHYDETYVRSVPCRTTITIPASSGTDNNSVVVTDSEGDVADTGTVTFDSFWSDIPAGGLTSATTTYHVTMTVHPGADGGSLTNTASIASTYSTGGGLCGNATIDDSDSATALFHGESGTTPPPFADYDFCTEPANQWGQKTGSGSPLFRNMISNDFANVYVSPASVTIGGGHTATFDSADAIVAYLFDGGSPGTFDNNYTDPVTTSAGQFGSEVLASRLNVDFSAYAGTSPTAAANVAPITAGFGDLYIVGGTSGMKVSDVLSAANASVGSAAVDPSTFGVPGVTSIDEFNWYLRKLNQSFHRCKVTTWALNNLSKTDPATP